MIRFVRLLVADGEVVLALALVLSWVGAQGVAMLGARMCVCTTPAPYTTLPHRARAREPPYRTKNCRATRCIAHCTTSTARDSIELERHARWLRDKGRPTPVSTVWLAHQRDATKEDS